MGFECCSSVTVDDELNSYPVMGTLTVLYCYDEDYSQSVIHWVLLVICCIKFFCMNLHLSCLKYVPIFTFSLFLKPDLLNEFLFRYLTVVLWGYMSLRFIIPGNLDRKLSLYYDFFIIGVKFWTNRDTSAQNNGYMCCLHVYPKVKIPTENYSFSVQAL